MNANSKLSAAIWEAASISNLATYSMVAIRNALLVQISRLSEAAETSESIVVISGTRGTEEGWRAAVLKAAIESLDNALVTLASPHGNLVDGFLEAQAAAEGKDGLVETVNSAAILEFRRRHPKEG